jgi:hypothetical protein
MRSGQPAAGEAATGVSWRCRSPECCHRSAGVAFSGHSRQDQDVFELTLSLLRAITMATIEAARISA